MIKIENVEVVGIEHAIRGMRNPKNSWTRSDSFWNYVPCGECNGNSSCITDYHLGDADHELAMNLANGGPVHAKYRRMIAVYLDITAPLYWWKEFDTYKVGTVANSCSTMHKIHERDLTLDDFSHEHLDEVSITLLEDYINHINDHRAWMNELTDSDAKKDHWWQMIQLLPTSYNQRRTIMLNYEVLVGIYKWRQNHKLDEWRDFCKWIEQLPYSELITGKVMSKETEG